MFLDILTFIGIPETKKLTLLNYCLELISVHVCAYVLMMCSNGKKKHGGGD